MKKKLSPQELVEIQKCRRDPAYFAEKYCYLKDPIRGKTKFHLFKFQHICISKFLQYAFNIIKKPRQMGLSWTVAMFALWLITFFEDKNVLMISIKDSTAKALLKKVKYIYSHLPEFLQAEILEDNMSRLALATGSEVKSVPTSEEAGRSESLSLLIIDEAAYVRWMEQIWQAAYPTLSTGGAAIVLSTTNGMGNFFCNLWEKSIEGRSLFNPICLHWYYYPGRDLKWLEIQKANMSQMQIAQEIMGDFISSGNLVFDIAALRALQEECSMLSPLDVFYGDEEGIDSSCGLYIFEHPDANEDYIVSADTAKGGGADFHAAHVLRRSSGLQAAEYRSKVPLEVFNRRLHELCSIYNYGLAGIENNNMGIATNLYFKERDYPRIYEHFNPLKPGSKEYGFPTNTQTRPILIDELEACIREGQSGVRGIRTVNELMNFAWSKKGKAEAMEGKHDDLVISLGIGRYIRKMTQAEVALPMLYM